MDLTDADPTVAEIPYSFDPLEWHLLDPQRYPFLLESAAVGTAQGRYDLVFGFPGATVEWHGEPSSAPFLSQLDTAWAAAGGHTTAAAGELPFAGGWFLLLGYELAGQVEPRLTLRRPAAAPGAVAVRMPLAVVRDHEQQRAWICAEAGCDDIVRVAQADLQRLQRNRGRTGRLVEAPPSESPDGEFLDAVTAAKRHIAAGDIFQANLSREWRGRLRDGVSAGDVYRRLRASNPAPFAGLATLGDVAVVSSSPERLIRVAGRHVETRPIAGTRPRRTRSDLDRQLSEELLAHPKERAEHIMLLDLERNDLGRVCEAGSVVVSEMMALESYRHVHHIVSNVQGRLRDDVSPGDAIGAVFPGGTITGCPKVRCMELIAELEDRPRGFYTGAMGYLGHDGSMDLNILIRSIELAGRALSFAAGAGIVADSDPDAELAETRAKAKGLLMALD